MSDCDTYMWPAPKVTTQSMSGFSGSVTKACRTWLSIGSVSTPALRITSDVIAGDGDADLRRADRAARWSSTPTTRSPAFRKPVTSQFSMMSTPSRSAAWAKPQATASWRAVPARGCRRPPTTGKRAFSLRSRPGQSLAISSGSSSSASMPLSRMRVAALAHTGRAAPGVLREVEHAALREHDVVVERVAEALPELQAPLVEMLRSRRGSSWSGRSSCCGRHCPGRSSRAPRTATSRMPCSLAR